MLAAAARETAASAGIEEAMAEGADSIGFDLKVPDASMTPNAADSP